MKRETRRLLPGLLQALKLGAAGTGLGQAAATPPPATAAPMTSLGGLPLPKGISTGGLGSVSAATPPPSMIWNGKMPGGSGDPSSNGQFALQPGGGGRPAQCTHALVPISVCLVFMKAHAGVTHGDQLLCISGAERLMAASALSHL